MVKPSGRLQFGDAKINVYLNDEYRDDIIPFTEKKEVIFGIACLKGEYKPTVAKFKRNMKEWFGVATNISDKEVDTIINGYSFELVENVSHLIETHQFYATRTLRNFYRDADILVVSIEQKNSNAMRALKQEIICE